jgi:hypothetical protein
MKVIKRYNLSISSLTLWISIIIFVFVTVWIIRTFDNQDNQDQDKLDRQMSYQINTN